MTAVIVQSEYLDLQHHHFNAVGQLNPYDDFANLFVTLNFKIMKLQTMDLEMYGMAELSIEDQLCLNGEYSWNQFCGDAGYVAGSAVAYATNAGGMANRVMVDIVTGKFFESAFK